MTREALKLARELLQQYRAELPVYDDDEAAADIAKLDAALAAFDAALAQPEVPQAEAVAAVTKLLYETGRSISSYGDRGDAVLFYPDQFHQLAEKLVAMFAAPQPDPRPAREWQPIETAPNGWILVAGTPGPTGAGFMVVRRNGDEWESADDGYGPYITPTHWMPVPALPRPSGELGTKHDGSQTQAGLADVEQRIAMRPLLQWR